MVQYFRGGPSRSALWAQMLGPAAGQGLGSMLSAYQTNKALEGVLNDPQYKDKSQGEKMGALQTALGRFGERGQKAIQQRLMAEQQLEQEARNKAENKFLSGAQDLSEQEQSLIRPELRVQTMKAQAPKGGVSAQPVPPEIGQAIPQVLNANPKANADELALAFDEAGIPRTYSNSYIENRRRQDESKAKSIPEAFKETREERKKILEQGRAYQDTKMRLDRMEELNKQGKLSTPAMATALDKFGLPLGVLGNPNSEEFDKLSQDLFKDIQSTFGNRILKVEVDNFAKTIPTLRNTVEGRQRIINNMRLLGEGKKLAYEAYKEIMKGRESPPLDLLEQIDEKVSEKLDNVAERFKNANQPEREIPEGKVKVKSPNGKEGTIPQQNLDEARKKGYVVIE